LRPPARRRRAAGWILPGKLRERASRQPAPSVSFRPTSAPRLPPYMGSSFSRQQRRKVCCDLDCGPEKRHH